MRKLGNPTKDINSPITNEALGLQQLQEIRDEFRKLNYSLEVQPVLWQLDFILERVQDGMPVEVGSFLSLVDTVEKTHIESLEGKL